MSNDIVSQMVNEMNVPPQMLQQMSDQQKQMSGGIVPSGQMGQQHAMVGGNMKGMQPGMGMQPGVGMQPGTGMQQGMGMPGGSTDVQNMTPEQQMMYMQQIQQQSGQQMPQQTNYQHNQQQQMMEESSDSESTMSGGEESFDPANYGMNSKGTLFDQIVDNVKLPLVVFVLFCVLSLPQVTKQVDSLLPSRILTNLYYHVAVKGLVAAVLFFGASLVL